jgi:hypothetical protein
VAKKSRTSVSRADEQGFVVARTNPNTNRSVVLYSGEEAGFDITEGKWTIFCTDHGTFANESNQRRARKLMREPHQWCPECKKLQEQAPDLPAKLVPYDQKDADQKAKELRFMANIVKLKPEKAKLFEIAYGVSAERYWD